jgi:hypothetical protein
LDRWWVVRVDGGVEHVAVQVDVHAGDHRRGVVPERFERAGPERVEIGLAVPLGQMDVAPARRDPAEQLARHDVIVRAHRREDVPVRERVPIGLPHGDRVRIEVDGSGCDRIDGRPVRRRDVDAEMERVLGRSVETAALPRIVERAPDRMRPVERLDRPPVCLRACRREQCCDACRSGRKASTHSVRETLSLRVFTSD